MYSTKYYIPSFTLLHLKKILNNGICSNLLDYIILQLWKEYSDFSYYRLQASTTTFFIYVSLISKLSLVIIGSLYTHHYGISCPWYSPLLKQYRQAFLLLSTPIFSSWQFKNKICVIAHLFLHRLQLLRAKWPSWARKKPRKVIPSRWSAWPIAAIRRLTCPGWSTDGQCRLPAPTSQTRGEAGSQPPMSRSR